MSTASTLPLNAASAPTSGIYLSAVNLGKHNVPVPATITNDPEVTEKTCKWHTTSPGEELVVTDHVVMWYESGELRRKFGFPSDTVTHALFTHFEDPAPASLDEFAASTATDGARRKSGKLYGSLKDGGSSSKKSRADRKRAIVIVLTEFAHIFFLSGARYVVNIPFAVKRVFATDRGLVLERDSSSGSDTSMPQLLDPSDLSARSLPPLPRFFSLMDPMADLGLVTKLSTKSSTVDSISAAGSTLSQQEELVFMSERTPKGAEQALLAATYDYSTKMVSVYHFRYLSTDGNVITRRRTMSRRRSSMLQSMTEDTSIAPDMSPMDNRRTSTSRTDISLTIDRMGGAGVDASEIMGMSGVSGTGPMPFLSWWYDLESLKKEIEFSHIESFAFSATRSDLKCFNLVDSERKCQALGFVNRDEGYVMLLLFSLEGKQLRFEDSTKIPARDAVNMSGDESDGLRHRFVLLLLPDGTLRLYDPFLRMYSPQLHTAEVVTELVHAMADQVSLRLADGSLTRIEVVLSPRTTSIRQAFQIVNSMLDPIHQVLLGFKYSAALLRQSTSLSSRLSFNEWDVFAVALLAAWIGPGLSASDQLEESNSTVYAKFLAEDTIEDQSRRYLAESEAWFGLLASERGRHRKWPFAYHAELAIALANDVASAYGNSNWVRNQGVIVCALHLLAEELKLDVAATEAKGKVDMLLGQLIRWLGWGDQWKEAYTSWNMLYDEVPRFAAPEILASPPNIFAILYDALVSPLEVIKPEMPTLFDIAAHRATQTTVSKKHLVALLPKSKFVIEIFTILVTYPKSTVYRNIIDHLLQSFSTAAISPPQSKGRALMNEIERFPECIVVVFKEAIIWCQEHTPTEWGVDALELIGRRDLKKLVELGIHGSDLEISRQVHSRDKPREISQIVQSVLTEADSLGPWDGVSEVDRANVSKLIFREDRRMQEVQKLLQATRMQSGKFEYSQLSSSFNEADMHTAQQELARMIGTRTLAVPVGRGAFLYSARIPLLTEKFPIPKMNFNIVMKPSMATITVDKHLMSEANISWGLFHNGVASGLSVSKDAKEITGSWIVFNKPQELSSQHAGFLLGLGLNGHLKNLAEWHIYNYLRPKHTLTSIALLLGMSTSYLGTLNPKMTKVLSVHVVALLPAGSADLNISGPMQTAGIMGVGLLYYGSHHRRMSEILIAEIDQFNASGIGSGGRKLTGRDLNSNASGGADGATGSGSVSEGAELLRDEGYLLAAGFALGLINIGCGSDVASLGDLHLMERLLAISTGNTGNNGVMGIGAAAGGGVAGGASAQKHHLLDKSAAGCIIALLLIYLKTEDVGVAEKIDVPETAMLFEYVRPDLLLLRTLASRLIMWSTIGKTRDWISSTIRGSLRPRADLRDVISLDSDDLPLLNIVCGLCFAMGIRYAGRADSEAKVTLLYYLDQFIRLCSLPASTHDQLMTKSTARTCQNVLALSCAVVMAGTGDLDVLRRLRRLHGTIEPTVPYGSHLATHLALGILFVGGGEYSLDTSSPMTVTAVGEDKPSPTAQNMQERFQDPSLLAVAGLVIALYPQFPNDVLDNQVHLQAFRHFWTLACQNRCVVVRDIETMRPVMMPVTIGYKVDESTVMTKALTAPCLLPPLSTLVWLKTSSADHWPVVLDLQNNEAHARALRETLTVYTEDRRGGYQRRSSDGSVPFGGLLRGLGPPGNASEEREKLYAEGGNSVSVTSVSPSVQKLLDAPLLHEMDRAEKALVVPADMYARRPQIQSTSADITSTLARFIENPGGTDDLWNVRVAIHGFPQWAAGDSASITTSLASPDLSQDGKPLVFMPLETVERLKVGVWRMHQAVAEHYSRGSNQNFDMVDIL
ncbi:hypothetical protein POJ06DRAFT_244731 [Lipomyces tetrasporus]|uniref:Anaphase-promoting complex subunit 1 N-terminal domain-containing protein n=1 Tax=Lipomyces tetrasporus TaxID=54092 RepID=A0AAD7VV15_9ASCO|nr:uncharacterized protein POJ06DRAFT_244731 [Lipomyces tetrasporus]KAJ8102476.1 hypothetical protein POJ06DRAFT_244731 [Lipomyces tetrasporus]